MISDEEKGNEDVEEQAHVNGDDRDAEQLEAGSKPEDMAREVGGSKHPIYAWKASFATGDATPRERFSGDVSALFLGLPRSNNRGAISAA
jgi:hypothetical protein